MNYSDKSRIADIIVRQKIGSVSADEQSHLDQWLDKSPVNREMYDRIMSGKSVRWHTENFADINTPAMIADIRQRIRSNRRRRRLIASASVAAVFVAGIFASVFFIRHKEPAGMPIQERHYAIMTVDEQPEVRLAAESSEEAWREHISEPLEASAAQSEQIKIRMEVPRGAEYKIKLDDGTVIWLNSETTLEYPQKFDTDKRNIYLSGEAFFEVAADPDRPFIVSTPSSMEVAVLGTSFNINTHDEDYITTVLVAGRVAIGSEHSEEAVFMSPDQIAMFDKNTGTVSIDDVDIAPYVAWKEGRIHFRDESMGDIMDKLSRWYNIEVAFADDSIKSLHFTGNIKKNVDLDILLDAMTSGVQLRYTIEGNLVTLSYK